MSDEEIQRQRDVKMFGCPREDLDRAVEFWKHSDSPWLMLAMSILSDAQELLASGHAEAVRQRINRAKYLLICEKERRP
jgi:hypothetical protein